MAYSGRDIGEGKSGPKMEAGLRQRQSLMTEMETLAAQCDPLTLHRLCAHAEQIISGVEYCHRHMVVHRDLKVGHMGFAMLLCLCLSLNQAHT